MSPVLMLNGSTSSLREPRVGSPRPAPTAPASRRDTLLAAAAAALLGPGTAAEARGEGGGSASPAFQVSAEGLRTLKLRDGGTGITPAIGDEVEINFTGRLASKQGWYFENTYQHKGPVGFPLPYRFTVGDGSVIEGLDLAVQRMSKGDILRAVIPPALSYQSTAQGPVPQEWSNRRRLYSTIFNEVRMANGRGGEAVLAPEGEGEEEVLIAVPPVESASSEALVAALVAMVNEAYSYGEAGMWAGEAQRTAPPEVAALLAAGRLSLATGARSGELAGCVCVDEAAGELGMLAVATAQRGRGLAGRLVAEAEARCAAAGRDAVRLQVLFPRGTTHPVKVWLEAWYQRLGYAPQGSTGFAELYPAIAPMLASECDLTDYVKQLPSSGSQRNA
eukprot:jgi/Tetstr1/460669/TSEL_005865.t1